MPTPATTNTKDRRTEKSHRGYNQPGGSHGSFEGAGQLLPVDDNPGSATFEKHSPCNYGEHDHRKGNRRLLCHVSVPSRQCPAPVHRITMRSMVTSSRAIVTEPSIVV